jgi:hypothetical protein
MKSSRLLFASIAPFVFAMPAALAATDVTSSLEYLFTPLESRYGTSTDYQSSRGCHCLEYIDGRIYIGGGDWGNNTGPVPIISILPGATPTWTNEYSAGTEQIEAFKKFSDGRIWTRATDPREHDSNYGSFFAKYPGGDWVPCPLGSIDWNPAHQLNGAELYTHSWDFCEYNGNFYFTGYGVGVSADENTARGIAMTAALGDLSTKLQAEVRTASSNYQRQTGNANSTLFESLTESVSRNRLQGVAYKGDRSAQSYRNGRYTYRIEARLSQTVFRQNVERILDEMDATADERAAFKREMFGE